MTTQKPPPPPAPAAPAAAPAAPPPMMVARPLPGLVPEHVRQQAAGLVPPDPSAVREVAVEREKKRRPTRIPTTAERDALIAGVRADLARLRDLKQAAPVAPFRWEELGRVLGDLGRDANSTRALHALCAVLMAHAEAWPPLRALLEPFVNLPPLPEPGP